MIYRKSSGKDICLLLVCTLFILLLFIPSVGAASNVKINVGSDRIEVTFDSTDSEAQTFESQDDWRIKSFSTNPSDIYLGETITIEYTCWGRHITSIPDFSETYETSYENFGSLTIEDRTEGKKIIDGEIVIGIGMDISDSVSYTPSTLGTHDIRIYIKRFGIIQVQQTKTVTVSSGDMYIDNLSAQPNLESDEDIFVGFKISGSVGQTVSINWELEYAEDGGSTSGTIAFTSGMSSQTVEKTHTPSSFLSGTNTVTLTISDGSGILDTETTTYRRDEIYPDPVFSFSVNPDNIRKGDSAQLSWSGSYVDHVTITPDIGSVNPILGSKTVQPTQTTTYCYAGAGKNGKAFAGSKTVEVSAIRPSVSIHASPTSIILQRGETKHVILTVQSENADSVSIDQGLSMGGHLAGELTATPTSSTTYTVTASNDYDSVTDSVFVEVQDERDVYTTVTLSASKQAITPGESVELFWESTNADTVLIDHGIDTEGATSGSITIRPFDSVAYTATAVGSTTATDSIIIQVSGTGTDIESSDEGLNIDENTLIMIALIILGAVIIIVAYRYTAVTKNKKKKPGEKDLGFIEKLKKKVLGKTSSEDIFEDDYDSYDAYDSFFNVGHQSDDGYGYYRRNKKNKRKK
jgi:hypothetical protein